MTLPDITFPSYQYSVHVVFTLPTWITLNLNRGNVYRALTLEVEWVLLPPQPQTDFCLTELFFFGCFRKLLPVLQNNSLLCLVISRIRYITTSEFLNNNTLFYFVDFSYCKWNCLSFSNRTYQNVVKNCYMSSKFWPKPQSPCNIICVGSFVSACPHGC